MYMNVVFPTIVLMIRRFDSRTVATVTLTDCFMPNQIILTILVRPNWNQDFLQTSWSYNITNNRIKGTCLWIVVFNCQRTTWFVLSNFCNCLCHITSMIIGINKMYMNVVFPTIVLMIRRFDSRTVATVTLTDCFMPNQIILTILVRPNWNQDFLQTSWSYNITNNRIKGSCLIIFIFNA